MRKPEYAAYRIIPPMTKAFAALYACTGAFAATVGVGLAVRDLTVPSLLLAGAGLLLVSAGVVLWGRRGGG